ncbi:MAG TPA: sulfatase [Pirellulales bacterium]|nr:sulfatase [Pirellulales bacterium]
MAAVKATALKVSVDRGHLEIAGPMKWVWESLLALYEDAAITLVVCLAAGAIVAGCNSRRVSNVVVFAVWLLFGLMATYAVANLKLWRTFHSWLTYPLYFHSGGLTELEMGVRASISKLWVAKCVGVGCGFFLAPCLLMRFPRRSWIEPCRIIRRRAILLPTSALLLLAWYWRAEDERQERRNPHLLFVSSCLQNVEGIGSELTLDPVWFDEFGPIARESRIPQPPCERAPARGTGMNVVLVVLESVGADFLRLYGGAGTDAPTLEELSEHGLVFTNIYAHAPLTAEAIVAINSSLFPRSDAKLTTWENPGIDAPDLAQVLGEHGYRTAFVSQTFRGRGIHDYVASRHFDLALDAQDLGYGDAIDDLRLGRFGLRWIDRVQSRRPFFLMIWTYQTHYPYYAGEPSGEGESGRPRTRRFRAAVRAADQMLRELVAGLKTRGLWDDTILVVTGDHGQSLSSKEDMSGARDLRDSSLHVPLVIVSPKLFSMRKQMDVIGQHVDLAPTIVDLLGLAAPSEWQGKSMFAARRSPRAYFIDKFAVRPVYGLREGAYKFLAATTDFELYDCDHDPQEVRNCASDHPELCRRFYKHLTSWRRFQASYFDQFTARR